MATPRAGVIPTSIKDETGAIARQQAEANDRMAQLFYTLLAKREDRLFAAQQRQQAAADADARWYQRFDYSQAAKNNPQQGGYTSPGAQPDQVGGSDNAGVAHPTNAAPANSMPGSPAILDHRKFSTNTSAPANVQTADAGYDGPTDVSASARNSFAQASPQEIQEGKAERKLHPTGAHKPPTTSLPRPSNRRPAPQVMFQRVTPEVAAAWADAEKQNGLPPGQLLFTYGMETNGGRTLGKADGTGPQGPFQWTPQLLREKGLSALDAQDYIKMGYATAKNMAENHQQLVKRTTAGGQAVQLSNSVNDMSSWHVLHQWGRSGGPSIVAASKLNPGMMLVDLLPKNIKRRDGTVGDASEWLVMNGLNAAATVVDTYKQIEQRGHAYRTAAVTGKGLPDANAPTTSQGAPAGPQVAGGQPPQQQAPQAQPPRPPADVPNAGMQERSVGSYVRNQQAGGMGANPRLMAAVLGGAKMALPPNYTVRQTSGYRPGDSGYHGRREAADFQIIRPDGSAIPNRGEDTTGLYTRIARGVKTWIAENDPGFQVNYGGAHGTAKRGGGVPDLMHYDTGHDRGNMVPNVRMSRLQPLSPQERNAPEQGRTQVARAPAKQAAPSEASAQRRGPIDKYEYTENLPSEGKRDVTMDFRGPTSYAYRGGAAPDTAQAKPTPTPQQQPSLPQGIRPQTPYTAPPGWPTGQEPAVPVRPAAPTAPVADPTTVPQDLPFEANYPAPPTVDMPMPPQRPLPSDLQMRGVNAMAARGRMQPSMPAAADADMFGGMNAPGTRDAGDFATLGAAMPPLDVPMPRARPQDGAPSVDETGFEQAYPPMPPPQAQTMDGGNDYTGAQSVDEAGMIPAPVMAVPEGNEYAADVMATPEGNEFEVPNMAAAAGNEFAPPPKLPGANLTMPTKPFGMQERRQGAQAPPQPLPADYMSPTQRIQQALGGPNGAPIGGGDTSMGGVPEAPAWWPPPHERWKMQNAARDALFAKARQAFQPDAPQATPPVADIPLPPEGDGGGPPAEATQSRMLQALRQAASGGPPQGAPPVSDIPMPPQDDGGPSTDDTTMDKLARLFRRGTDAVSGAPPQDAPPTSDIPPPVAGDAGPGVPQDTGPSRYDWITEAAKRDLPAIYPYTPGGAARTAIDKVVELFKQRGGRGGATPAPPADAQATPTAPTFQPRKVKVQNIGPGGQPVLPDGEPIKIPNPNQPRGMANTPLPDFGTGGGSGAAKPTTATPPPPKPGAGKATGFRQWVLPNGQTITTKPGEEPPAGAKPVQ